MEPFSVVWLAAAALDAVAISLAVTRRRGVAGTLAWIFAILAIPIAGALAYFLLANPSLGGARRRRRLSAARVGELVRHLDEEGLHAASPLATSVVTLAARTTGLLPTDGNRVTLLVENAAAFSAFERAILSAKRSVWAEFYIVQDDETGRRFLDLLAARARDGLDVRLLYDAVGSAKLNAERAEALAAAGGKLAPFLPVNPLRRRWSIHLRNHRKILVVDGAVAFTGGMNVGDEYSGYRRRRTRDLPWRDTHLQIEGPAARDLAQVFAEDWAFATSEGLSPAFEGPAPTPGGSVVGLLPSGPDQPFNANALAYFTAASLARERCFLTSPYFVPDEPTILALQSAALRGVDVRVLVPEKSDVRLVLDAAWSYFPPLLKAGVKVYQYRAAVLHAKTFVVDGTWGLVGSANVDIRSFSLNFEIGALVFDPEFALDLEARFLEDLKASVPITMREVSAKGWTGKVRGGVARLLSPLL